MHGVVPGWVLGWGMGTGWVWGRVIPVHPASCKAEHVPAKRAPEAPAKGLEWVGTCTARPMPRPHHSLRSGPLRWVWASPRANPASGPIGARLRSIFSKVSQNGIVSPKSVHKACLSPYFQNGLQISPLDFLGFPFSLAFSHKELIGLF